MNEQEYLQKKQEIAQRYMKELEELDKEFNLSLLNLEKIPDPKRRELILPSVSNLTAKAEFALRIYISEYIDKDWRESWDSGIPIKIFEENTINISKLQRIPHTGYVTIKFIVEAFIDYGLKVNFYGTHWRLSYQKKEMADLENRQEERKQKEIGEI